MTDGVILLDGTTLQVDTELVAGIEPASGAEQVGVTEPVSGPSDVLCCDFFDRMETLLSCAIFPQACVSAYHL